LLTQDLRDRIRKEMSATYLQYHSID